LCGIGKSGKQVKQVRTIPGANKAIEHGFGQFPDYTL
jgi:hypothetical protein